MSNMEEKHKDTSGGVTGKIHIWRRNREETHLEDTHLDEKQGGGTSGGATSG